MSVVLADISSNSASRPNGFSLVRLVAAVTVVVSHSFQFIDRSLISGFATWSSFSLGQHAVNAFFVLSGLLVTQSLERNPDLFRFVVARASRLLPGLFCCGLVVAFAIGPFATSCDLEDYVLDVRTIVYPFAILILFDDAVLPGLFQGTSHPGEANAPLWTVKYEILAYLCLALAAKLRLLSHRATTLSIVAGLALLLAMSSARVDPLPGEQVLRFAFAFLIGVAAYQYRTAIRLRIPVLVLLLILTVTTSGSPAGPAVAILFVAHLVFRLGALRVPGLSEACDRTDLSYGIYIYSWPIQQTILVHAGPDIPIALHLLLTLLLAAPLALLSWSLVEKPALRLKDQVGLFGKYSSRAA